MVLLQFIARLARMGLETGLAQEPPPRYIIVSGLFPSATGQTFFGLMGNVIQLLLGVITAVAAVVFIAGALMYTTSGFKEDLLEKGKSAMIGSLIAIAISLGAYAITQMTFYILQ